MKTVSSEEFLEILNSGNKEIKHLLVSGDILINQITSAETFIDIEGVKFLGKVIFNSSDLEYHLDFIKCDFEDDFHIYKSYVSNIVFRECSFTKIFWIDFSQFTTITIDNISVGGSARIESIESKFLSVSWLQNQAITIYNPQVQDLRVTGIKDNSEVYITDSSYKAEYTPVSKVGSLRLSCSNDFKSRVYIKNTKLIFLELTGHNKDGKIIIKNAGCKNIIVEDFINDGLISVNGLYPLDNTSSMVVNSSNIANCEIYNTKFSAFNTVNIKDSIIENIMTSNIEWCDEVDKGNAISRPENLRETYRQLKNIMIRSRNKPEELKFFGLEMDAYYQQLKKSKGRFDEKFILYTNRISNKHGLSWVRALNLIISLNIILYVSIKISIDELQFSSEHIIVDLTNYLEFINPIRSYYSVFESNNGVAKLIDYIARILNSYLIFQFLRAFRRFVRN